MEKDYKNIEFNLPEEQSLTDVIYDILEKNNLQEDFDQWLNKYENDLESRDAVINDAALVACDKEFPEQKLLQLLQEHLETPLETAKNVLKDIKEKLVPFATADTNTQQRELIKKILINKAAPEVKIEPQKEMNSLKEAPILNVEKNVKNTNSGVAPKLSPNNKFSNKAPQPPPNQEVKSDPYKEPIQ